MPFKIIQTKEQNRVQLITVPSSWEQDSVLRWPKQAWKFIKDNETVPQADWSSLPCSLKRSDIKTYQEAEKEISTMLMQSDTEEETNFHSKNQRIVMKTLDLNTAALFNIYLILEIREHNINLKDKIRGRFSKHLAL